MAVLVCPNCRSTNLRRSHARNFRERFLKIFNRMAYRCRDCGWRGIRSSGGGVSSRVPKKASYLFAVVFLVVIIALIIVFNFKSDEIGDIVRSLLGGSK